MKITMDWKLNLKEKEVMDKVQKAGKKAILDVVVAIANDSIRGSPKLTGNNARSIQYEVGPSGQIAKNDNQGAVYSTSGYGGYLETGTVRMGPRPYMKPALDRHIKELPEGIKAAL